MGFFGAVLCEIISTLSCPVLLVANRKVNVGLVWAGYHVSILD
jgi:hypothetical protein